MIAESLKILYIVSAAYVVFVTIALLLIQGQLAVEQKIALFIFWLLLSTPMLEYIGLAFNYMPYPFIAFVHSSLLLLGPSIYFYITYKPEAHFDYTKCLLHLFPFVIFYTGRLVEQTEIPTLLALLYFVHVLFYQFLLTKTTWFSQHETSNKRTQFLISQKAIVVFFLVVSSAYFVQVTLHKIGSDYLRLLWDLSNTLTFIYILMLSKGFIDIVKIKQAKSNRVLELAPELANQQKKYLTDLFEKDQLHLNNELSLTCLAKELDLTSNQTSELLNEHLNTNFYEFVNTYRVQTAAYMLKHASKKTKVSELYLDAGFNNKNTFYREFKKAFNMSPGEFKTRFSKATKH
ncbi:helix-turn-helix domain-containing protein [Pseudoalteromonas sp. SMS1]|uniref:helix-turn-helix domain-containing protein n=1 Tax=Pseudoalteromonas sp. SMS1 TaxID=2908894 RepID=UPI001F3A212C|nr:helix-turn-helix domain-containing protein [Pseudoalteromonas sp. SMS1]MCF2858407.1 helix-turn-helix domain-containing protein [Pseudoalteromonas sp. SMS1]